MGRVNTIQTNFTSGELSPNMYGRVDVAKYFNGARKLQGVICLPQGGVRRTPGTKYLGTVKDSSKKTLLRPFTFSQNDAYVLEFSHLKLRIWQTGALLGTPTAVEVTTPYGENDLAGLRFAQSADTLFIAHGSYYPRVLTRTSSTVWTLAAYANEDGPYAVVTPKVNVTLTVSRGGTGTITSSKVLFVLTGSPTAIVSVVVDRTLGHYVVYAAGTSSILVTGHTAAPGVNGAWMAVPPYNAGARTVPGVGILSTDYQASGGTWQQIQTAFVEYREDNLWKAAQVFAVTSDTVATVKTWPMWYAPSEVTTNFNWDSNYTFAPVVTASASGVFTPGDVGKLVRVTSVSGTAAFYNTYWAVLTKYVNSYTMGAEPLAVANYNDSSYIITVSGQTIIATLTAKSTCFASTDVGKQIRLKYGSHWTVGTITVYTSATVVTVVLVDFPPLDDSGTGAYYNGGETDTWKMSAWGSVEGYPETVNFHQNRVVWGGNTAEPSAVWMTKSGDYYSFEPSDPTDSVVADDNAISVNLLSRRVGKPKWLDSGSVLLVGTEGGEWQVKPSSIQQTLTPTNVSATVQTAFGSANLDANRIGAQTLFIERTGLKLRELRYDYSVDAFASADVSILSEHLLREHGGIVDWSVQHNPYTVIWLVMGDGKVLTVTYEREQEVVAWSQQDIGGIAESVCCAPSATGEDLIYFIVKRTINGATVRYVEMITGLLSTTSIYLNCWSQLVQTAAPVASYTASHLPAATVGVVLDGVYIGDTTASSGGVVDLTYDSFTMTVTVATVGFRNTAIIGILDLEGGSQAGSSQAKKKRISESAMRVISSWYPKIASGAQNTNETENLNGNADPVAADYTRIVPAWQVIDPSSLPPINPTTYPITMVSGDISFAVDDTYENGAKFQIVQDEPYPLNITCLMHKLNTNE
jgi:hypothetical protein